MAYHDLPVSRFLEKEFNKSVQFQKKHEKELNHLIHLQKLMKEEREKNEHKLNKLFTKQRQIDQEKRAKEYQLRELKVNKDQQFLHKNKEKDYLNSLDSSWCYYKEYSPMREIPRDQKPQLVNLQRDRVLDFLDKSLIHSTDPNEKVAIKQKIAKLQNSEVFIYQTKVSHHKLHHIENKIKIAKLQKNNNLDRSIDKIRAHDVHIMDVLEKSQQIEEDRYKYYRDKIFSIQEKIKFIEDLQKINNLKIKQKEEQKDQHRQIVKSQSDLILQQKKNIHLNHLEEKNYKINQLEDQRIRLNLERQSLLEQLESQRKKLKSKIDDDKYPMLNSINYKALNY